MDDIDNILDEQMKRLEDDLDEICGRMDELYNTTKPALDLIVTINMRVEAILTLLLKRERGEPPA